MPSEAGSLQVSRVGQGGDEPHQEHIGSCSRPGQRMVPAPAFSAVGAIPSSVTADSCDTEPWWQCPGKGSLQKDRGDPSGMPGSGSPSLLDGSTLRTPAPQKPPPSPPQPPFGAVSDQTGQLRCLPPGTPTSIPAAEIRGDPSPPPCPPRRAPLPARPRPPLPRRPHGNPSPRVPSADQPGMAQPGGVTPAPAARGPPLPAGRAGGGGRGHRPAWEPRAWGAENVVGSDGKPPRGGGPHRHAWWQHFEGLRLSKGPDGVTSRSVCPPGRCPPLKNPTSRKSSIRGSVWFVLT